MDLEAELLKSIAKEELELHIAETIKSFHGFLTREVAIRLLAKEMGLLKQEDKTYKIADIPKGEKRITFTANVKKIWPVATYSSGKQSRVVEIEDETGTKPLIFWNADIELTKNLRLKDRILASGVYEKSGELHLSYTGKLEISEKAGFSSLKELVEDEIVHVRGIVQSIEGYDGFIRKTGGSGKTGTTSGFSFILTDGENERRCVVFDGADRAEKLAIGDEVIIEGGVVGNDNIELETSSRILSRRKNEMLIGTITQLECKDEKVLLGVGTKETLLDRSSALRFFGVSIADDIQLTTVVNLKKGSLLNTRIAIKIEHKDGQIVVRC